MGSVHKLISVGRDARWPCPRFEFDVDLPAWRPEWPALTFLACRWGKGAAEEGALEIWFQLGDLEAILADRPDGWVFNRNGRALDVDELGDRVGILGESDREALAQALAALADAFHQAVDGATAPLLAEARTQALEWLAGQLSQPAALGFGQESSGPTN